MYSRNHAIISTVAATGIVALTPPDQYRALLWTYLVVVGVGIDVDHFLVARLNRGDWGALRRCYRRPLLVFRDQSAIFNVGDVWRDQRLLSHVVIGGGLVGLWWFVDVYWATTTALLVYLHVAADLYSDIRTRRVYLRRAANVLDA